MNATDTVSRTVDITSLKPQTYKVLSHLLVYESITGKEAWEELKCRSLSKRISELRRAGVPIRREYRKDKYGQRYARYRVVP